jgi:hypothetical protein
MHGYIAVDRHNNYFSVICDGDGRWYKCTNVAQLAKLMQITHAAIKSNGKQMKHFFPIDGFDFYDDSHRITHSL